MHRMENVQLVKLSFVVKDYNAKQATLCAVVGLEMYHDSCSHYMPFCYLQAIFEAAWGSTNRWAPKKLSVFQIVSNSGITSFSGAQGEYHNVCAKQNFVR